MEILHLFSMIHINHEIYHSKILIVDKNVITLFYLQIPRQSCFNLPKKICKSVPKKKVRNYRYHLCQRCERGKKEVIDNFFDMK